MMKFDVRKTGGITLLALRGKLSFNDLSSSELSKIGETIKLEISHAENSKVVIDLSNVSMIDSSVIGFLIVIYKHVVLRNGSIAFVRPNEDIMDAFHNLGLARVFKFYESEDTATLAMQ